MVPGGVSVAAKAASLAAGGEAAFVAAVVTVGAAHEAAGDVETSGPDHRQSACGSPLACLVVKNE